MKQTGLLALLLLCLLSPIAAQQNDSVVPRLSVVGHDLCASLSWQRSTTYAGATHKIFLRYPSADEYDSIGATADTVFDYCIPRQVCGDTVMFRIAYCLKDSIAEWGEAAGERFDDPSPTSPCKANCASVDEASQQIVLSWHPSPDPDIMGYYICAGNPCTDYDTVWGRLDTTYICADHSANDENLYRILAFDSCFRASALTPYLGNLVLRAATTPCSRTATLSWNAYQNMRGGVAYYVVETRIGQSLRHDTIAPTEPLTLDITTGDSIAVITSTVTAVGNNAPLFARSNSKVIDFDAIDSAHYIIIGSCGYDMEKAAIVLEIEIDSAFHPDYLILYRATDSNDNEAIATIAYISANGLLTYEDRNINLLQASQYTYRVGVMDRCGTRQKLSAPCTATLPSTETRGAIFPNVIMPSRIDNNRFCPSLRFVDASYYNLYIYNRAGMLVFHTSDPSCCWDGRHNGHELSQGVYTYLLRCRYIDGSLGLQYGTVLILE